MPNCDWDDTARTVTCYDSNGDPHTRPYDDSENENADRAAAEAAAESTEAAILTDLQTALSFLQAVIDDTNANINQNPASRIKDMARVQRKVIRILTRRLDGTS